MNTPCVESAKANTFRHELKSDSHLPKMVFLFASIATLQNDEKYFKFHLKSSFRSQDV